MPLIIPVLAHYLGYRYSARAPALRGAVYRDELPLTLPPTPLPTLPWLPLDNKGAGSSGSLGLSGPGSPERPGHLGIVGHHESCPATLCTSANNNIILNFLTQTM